MGFPKSLQTFLQPPLKSVKIRHVDPVHIDLFCTHKIGESAQVSKARDGRYPTPALKLSKPKRFLW